MVTRKNKLKKLIKDVAGIEFNESDERKLFKKIYTKKPCPKCGVFYCICK